MRTTRAQPSVPSSNGSSGDSEEDPLLEARHPLVSVIVPAYNERELIGACLDSLLRQQSAPSYEIIVANNASTDDTAAIASAKGVRVVEEPLKGYVHALCRGVASARGDILAFTDADSCVPPHWLARLCRGLEDPRVVAVGGIFAFADASPWLAGAQRVASAFYRDLCGANVAVRREAFEAVGGFEGVANFGADTVLTQRLRSVGRVVIDHSLVVATSARRFREHWLREHVRHMANYVWLKLRRRPLFSEFADVRPAGQPVRQKSGIRRRGKRIAPLVSLFLAVLLLLTVVAPTVALPRRLPRRAASGFPRVVALTFDDGPDPEIIPQVLRILAERQVRATFFLVGKKVDVHPELALAIVEQDHVVGNHSYHHRPYSGAANSTLFADDFAKAQEAIARVTGLEPRLLRPPHGLASAWFLAEAKKRGYHAVGWTLDVRDWRTTVTQEFAVRQIVARVHPGSVILLHDGLDDTVGRQQMVVAALPLIIDELQRAGYDFVTVDRLLGVEPYFATTGIEP